MSPLRSTASVRRFLEVQNEVIGGAIGLALTRGVLAEEVTLVVRIEVVVVWTRKLVNLGEVMRKGRSGCHRSLGRERPLSWRILRASLVAGFESNC